MYCILNYTSIKPRSKKKERGGGGGGGEE